MSSNEKATDSGRSRGRDIALNVGAIAGLICVLAAVASFLFGIKPLIFRSGSMSPDIPTGALALSRATPAAGLQVGDVVSVDNQQGTRITHRVHEIVSSDGSTSVLILKGDANKDADLTPYTVTEADRVFVSVPGLGYVVSWLSSPAAIFLGGALVGGVMVLAFGPGSKRKDDDDSDSGSGSDTDGGTPEAPDPVGPPPAAYAHAYDVPTESFRTQGFSMRRIIPGRALIALGIASITAIGASAVGTAAAFTDNAAGASTIKSAANFFPTPLTTDLDCYSKGTAGFRQVEFWWPTVGNTPLGVPYTYQLIVKKGNTIVRNEHITTPPDGGGWHTRSQFRHSDTAQTYRVEIHTVNGPNMSTGYMAHDIRVATTSDTYCRDSNYLQANPAFENDIYGGIGPASAGGEFLRAAPRGPQFDTADPSGTPITSAQSTTETTESTTAEPSTSAPGTTAAPTATTTAPKTTTSTTQSGTTSTVPSSTQTTATSTEDATLTTTTTTPTPAVLAGAKVSPSGAYTAGRSGSDAVVQDAAGRAVFTSPVPETAALQWDTASDRLWIVDGDVVRYVAAGSWMPVTVDSASGEIPETVAALMK